MEPEQLTAISIVRQWELLGLNRSSYYYEAAGESSYNEYLEKLDEQYTETPFYGVLPITEMLRAQGEAVNPQRVGLESIYPKPKLSQLSDNCRPCLLSVEG